MGSICHNSLSGQEICYEVHAAGRSELGFGAMQRAGDTGRSRRMVCSVGVSHTASGVIDMPLIWHMATRRNKDIQCYTAINITKLKLLAFLTKYQIHIRYAIELPILPHCPPPTPPSAPGSMSKNNPMGGYAFPSGRTNPDCFA